MPIGQNSIKRVSSTAKEKAPQKSEPASTTLTNPAPEVVKMLTKAPNAEKKKCAPKSKAQSQKPAAKKAEEPKKTDEAKITDANKKDGFIKLSLGDELPTYLL